MVENGGKMREMIENGGSDLRPARAYPTVKFLSKNDVKLVKKRKKCGKTALFLIKTDYFRAKTSQ